MKRSVNGNCSSSASGREQDSVRLTVLYKDLQLALELNHVLQVFHNLELQLAPWQYSCLTGLKGLSGGLRKHRSYNLSQLTV